jgi:hypothetical protein
MRKLLSKLASTQTQARITCGCLSLLLLLLLLLAGMWVGNQALIQLLQLTVTGVYSVMHAVQHSLMSSFPQVRTCWHWLSV